MRYYSGEGLGIIEQAPFSLMNNIITYQSVHRLREEIGELKSMNEVYRYKTGRVADIERAQRQRRLLAIQDELAVMSKRTR